MATLYKRATFPQQRILRIIEGAVKNVADAHGEDFCPRRARSIAKRATGTLSSQWPEVLAATTPSGKAVRDSGYNHGQPFAEGQSLTLQPQLVKAAKKESGSPCRNRSPLRKLEKTISSQMRDIKNSGNEERAKAFIDILKMIAKLEGRNDRVPPEDRGHPS